MKHSIRRRIAFTFIGLVGLAVFLIGILNYTMLPQYYTMKKMEILEKSWNMINEVAVIPDGIQEDTLHFCINNNLAIVVTDAELGAAYSNSNTLDSNRMVTRLFGYATLMDKNQRDILKESGQYQVQKSYDPYVGLDYL